MIYAYPGSAFTAIGEGFATGLAGTIGVRIENADGTNHTARTTAGIVELEAASGAYAKTNLVAPTTAGTYIVLWDSGGATPSFASEELVVAYAPPASVPAAGRYTSPTDLRAELGVSSTVLDDAAATKLIVDAEDLIDELLGVRVVDETTGRKVVQSEVDGWRWTKLSRATVKLAARLHKEPGLTGRLWRSVSGPDFSFSGPLSGTEFGPLVEALLNQSGLRRLTTIAGPGRDRPPWFGFAYNADYD